MRQKKNLKRCIGIQVLVLMLIIGLFAIIPTQSQTVHAATKPKLNKQSVRLIKGQTTKLKLKGAKGTIKWKSSKKSVASVSKKGMIKARKKGSTKISAKYAGKTYKCKVWVEVPKISKTALALEIGQTETLAMQGTKQKVTWSSKQPEIAEVNATGVVTAKVAGVTTITAQIGNKKYACAVTIKEVSTQLGVTDTKPEETKPQPSEEIQSQQPEETKPQESEEIKPQQPEEIQPVEGISMYVQDSVVTTEDSMTSVMIENNTTEKITICDGYAIEKKEEEQWIKIPMDEEVDENELGGIISPGDSESSWIYFYKMAEWDSLEVGDYRITKIIKIGNEKKVLRAEFSCIQGILMVSMLPTGSCVIPTSQTSFEVEIKNYSNMDINVHLPCRLEKLVGFEWVDWNLGWLETDHIPSMRPQEALTYEMFLEPAYEGIEACEPGEYRVTTEFYAQNQSMVGYVYFKIVE
ncbi:MAG: Ig-like domain-containing protein [Lachnospiraceae bacterium]|nr:Ig-like domain-containing protein [Lachnospiraceae bacterium]